jgi:hypothetical protein
MINASGTVRGRDKRLLMYKFLGAVARAFGVCISAHSRPVVHVSTGA